MSWVVTLNLLHNSPGIDNSPQVMEAAIEQALSYGCVHFDGVVQCLHELTSPQNPPTSLELADRPYLQDIGSQPVDLRQYERLLKASQ